MNTLAFRLYVASLLFGCLGCGDTSSGTDAGRVGDAGDASQVGPDRSADAAAANRDDDGGSAVASDGGRDSGNHSAVDAARMDDSDDDAGCTLDAADVIWVLDNSASMAVEVAAVRDALNDFAADLTAKGVDLNLVLISSTATQAACAPGDYVCLALQAGMPYGACIDAPVGSGMCPDDSNPPSFLHLDIEVGSTNALDHVLSSYPQYAHMMRSGVPKHFIVVSDDDSATNAKTFSDGVDDLGPGMFPDWTLHAIYAFSLCADAAAVGTVYDTLITQTKGVRGDLCAQNFAPAFQDIEDAVATSAGTLCL